MPLESPEPFQIWRKDYRRRGDSTVGPKASEGASAVIATPPEQTRWPSHPGRAKRGCALHLVSDVMLGEEPIDEVRGLRKG